MILQGGAAVHLNTVAEDADALSYSNIRLCAGLKQSFVKQSFGYEQSASDEWKPISIPATTVVEDDWQLQLPTVPAPVLDLKRQAPDSVLLKSAAEPGTVLLEICTFLRQGSMPAEVKEPVMDRPWTVQAAVFVDNIEVDIEVNVFRSTEASFPAMVEFCLTTNRDVVRFRRVVDGFCSHAIAQGLATANTSSAAPQSLVFEDDFDDFESEDEDQKETWREKVKSLFALLEDSVYTTRLDGMQMLAQWAESNPECRPVLAEAFCSRPKAVTSFLQTMTNAPLCELYPMVSALKSITSCEEAAEKLHKPLLPVLEQTALEKLPKLAQQQLLPAFKALQQARAANIAANKLGKQPLADNLSVATTRFTASTLSCATSGWCDSSCAVDAKAAADMIDTTWKGSMPPDVERLCSMYASLWDA